MSAKLHRVALAALSITTASAAFGQTTDPRPEITSEPIDARAPAAAQPYDTSTMATGDWGGLRTRLHDRGVDLSVAYVNELAGNVDGGTHGTATDDGQIAFGATVDMDKAFGLRGGVFQTTITYRHGPSLDLKTGLGTLQQTQEVYGAGQTWRLTEFFYRQQLGGGVDVKVGRLAMGSDFAVFGCDFENLTFCGGAPGNIAGSYWHNWPVGQWGGVLRIKRTRWYAMVGAFESNDHLAAAKGFIFTRGGASGATVPVEFGYLPRLGKRGLPGAYKVGFWYNTDRADDVYYDVNRQPLGLTGLAPLQRTGRYGGYLNVRQQLTGRFVEDPVNGAVTTHGLTVFATFIQQERNTSRLDNQTMLGVSYIGAIPARPHDDIGFAIGRNNLNSRAAITDQLLAADAERAGQEYVGELYYGIHPAKWLVIRPDIQYIVHPGGYDRAPDAVVLGIKSGLTL